MLPKVHRSFLFLAAFLATCVGAVLLDSSRVSSTYYNAQALAALERIETAPVVFQSNSSPNKAFVAIRNPDSVAAIDTTNDTIIHTGTSWPKHPTTGIVTPDGSRAFFIGWGDGTIYGLDTSTYAITATIPLIGNDQRGIAVSPDGAHLYVADNAYRQVTAINLQTNSVITSVLLGSHPEQIALSPDGSHLYVAANNPAENYVIDTSTNTIVNTFQAGGYPNGIAVSRNGRWIYVSALEGTAYMVSADSLNTLKVISTPYPAGQMYRTHDGSKLYSMDYFGNRVVVININALAFEYSKTIALESSPTLGAISEDGTKLYVPMPSGDIAVINTATDTVIHTISVGGNPEGVAIKSPADIGFRSGRDGYRFKNWGPVLGNEFNWEDARRMFGDDAMCFMIGSTCIGRPLVDVYIGLLDSKLDDGHCVGMAVTSLLLFEKAGEADRDEPFDFQANAKTVYDLTWDWDIRRYISYYHVKQFLTPINDYLEQERQRNTPNSILDELRSSLRGTSDPLVLNLYKEGKGHAVVPYSVQDLGNGIYCVNVYDNNHPNQTRCVTFDVNNNIWSYDHNNELGSWSGNASTHSLEIAPLSMFLRPVCPLWDWGCSAGDTTDRAAELSTGEVWLAGAGHLLITNAEGKRVGYVGNQFVNEIPGTRARPIIGGLGIESEPIYTLPLTDTYTVLLDGQILTNSQEATIAQFGSGHAIVADNIALNRNSRDQFVFAADGSQIAFQSNEAKEATLTLALDDATQSNQFEIQGANIGAGQIVTLTANSGNEQLVFSNASAGGGIYDLRIKQVSTVGVQNFLHSSIAISATATHYIDYGSWDGSGSMTLLVDEASDGNIDATIELENQAPSIYLPLITRNS